MEWNKAKYFVILLLILLNGVLAGLNYQKNQENVLTASQEKAVFEVLAKNGVSLYTELLTKFPPMRKVALRIPSYSREDMKDLFFIGEETTVTVEFNRTIIKSPLKTLTMEGNRGNLHFPKGTASLTELTQSQAQRIAEEFMGSVPLENNLFTMGKALATDNGFIVEYFEKYKGEMLFASRYFIEVSKKGIENVDFTYFKPEGFIGEKREICFSDEALLTFLMERRRTNQEGNVTVTAMELGYDFQDYDAKLMETTDKLVPVYRIYVLGEKTPIIINAYTNEVIIEKDVN